MVVVDSVQRVLDALPAGKGVPNYLPAYRPMPNPAAIRDAHDRIEPRLSVLQWNKESFAHVQPRSYDLMVATYVFSYLMEVAQKESPKQFSQLSLSIMRQLLNGLKPGGHLILDSHSTCLMAQIPHAQIDERWGDLMSFFREVTPAFSERIFDMRQIQNQNPADHDHHFIFTRK